MEINNTILYKNNNSSTNICDYEDYIDWLNNFYMNNLMNSDLNINSYKNRIIGSIPINDNFECEFIGSLDSRNLVDTSLSLIDSNYWVHNNPNCTVMLYKGLTTTISETGEIYIYTGENKLINICTTSKEIDNWEKLKDNNLIDFIDNVAKELNKYVSDISIYSDYINKNNILNKNNSTYINSYKIRNVGTLNGHDNFESKYAYSLDSRNLVDTSLCLIDSGYWVNNDINKSVILYKGLTTTVAETGEIYIYNGDNISVNINTPSSDIDNWIYPLDNNLTNYTNNLLNISNKLASYYDSIDIDVSCDKIYGDTDGTGTHIKNSEIYIGAYPNNKYLFNKWNDGNTENPRKITILEDKEYVPSFIENKFNIKVTTENSSCYCIGDNTYIYNENIYIGAYSNTTDYIFKLWSDGNTENPRKIIVTEDKEYIPTFSKNLFKINVKCENTNVYCIGAGNYINNTTTYISAYSNTNNYAFTLWSDGNTENPRKIIVTGDKEYTAIFRKNRFNITIKSDNTSSYYIGAGSYIYNDIIYIGAYSNTTDYIFKLWCDGNTENPRKIIVTEDKEYTAIFRKNYFNITVTTSSLNCYCIGTGKYIYNKKIYIGAYSNTSNYTFKLWSDGNTENPRKIIVVEDKEYTAIFTTKK